MNLRRLAVVILGVLAVVVPVSLVLQALFGWYGVAIATAGGRTLGRIVGELTFDWVFPR